MSHPKQQGLLDDPVLRETVDEIIRIQPRFSSEPRLGPTGRGFLRSEGVQPMISVRAGRVPRKTGKIHLHK